jgi:hypothetical protein
MRLVYDVDDLLVQYRSTPKPSPGKLVQLIGIGDLDGYNPSGRVPDGTQSYVYVRVEPRQDEFASWSVPFRQLAPDVWEIEEDLPMLRLQDPFVARIHGTLVVGGVRILARRRSWVQLETVFLRGDSPAELVEFARSPQNMKDVRLVELEGLRVGVFTRPQGGMAGRGRIGYTEVLGLDALTTSAMADAELLETQPVAEHWWGANAVYALGEGTLGVFGHIAKMEGATQHYYPMAFIFDRQERRIVHGPTILADRSCFPPSAAKREDLKDVIFPASIDRDRGLLFGGLSDTAIGVLPVEDPFRQLFSTFT